MEEYEIPEFQSTATSLQPNLSFIQPQIQKQEKKSSH